MLPASFDLTGQVALVTGSSRGIGKALARGLLSAGAQVVLNARDVERLESARAELLDELQPRDPDRVRTVAFDVTDEDQVAAGVHEVGRVDILVNNTGIQRRAPITEFSTADFDDLMATNVRSAFLMSRAVGQQMIERGRGKIIAVCSVQSELARPGIAPYSATKGALRMLVKGLCADLAPHGICSNGLAPGYFDTELTSALVADEEFSAWVRRRTPAGRWGDVEDLVGPLIWLASSASDFVNGQTIFVDGGMTAVL